MEIISYLLKCFEIDIEVITTSEMDLDPELRSTDLLITILKRVGADIYLSGPSGKNYLDFDSKLLHSKKDNSTFDMLKDGDKFLKDLRREMGFNDSDKTNIMSVILYAEARDELKK